MQYHPLSDSFALVSLLGFILSVFFTHTGTVSLSWGYSFTLVFVAMFIASLITLKQEARRYF